MGLLRGLLAAEVEMVVTVRVVSAEEAGGIASVVEMEVIG